MLRKIRNRQKRLEFSDSSAALFNSSLGLDDLGRSNRGNPGILRRQESVIRKRNIEIIEQLLAEFDMDETVEKYRSQSIVEMKLDPNKCSYDTTASTIRLRDRIQSLMGSDVIRLNDRKYSEELRRKLDEEYEAKLRKKEETLAKAEKDRVRKLMLEGIIPMDDEADDPLMPKNRPKRKHRSRQKRSESAKGNDRKQSENVSRTPRFSSASPGRSQHIKTQVESEPETPKRTVQTPRSCPNSQQLQRNGMVNKETDLDNSAQNKNVTGIETRNDRLSDNGSLSSGSSSSSSRKRRSKSRTQENPLVQTLRQEETVAGLYDIAARLVVSPVN